MLALAVDLGGSGGGPGGAAAGARQEAVAYLLGRRQADGRFAEPGEEPDGGLTAWVALGLAAAGQPPGRETAAVIASWPGRGASATDLALAVLGVTASGGRASELAARLRALRRPDGSLGPALNSTVWGTLALLQAGEGAPAQTARYLLAHQSRSGGWAWTAGAEADSNDTAAAIEALAALDVPGEPIRRGLAFLRTLANPDGGFELTEGRGSDAQSTAWAIQAFLAAGERPGPQAYAYLARLRRRDGSYRYSQAYAVSPVWVTAQVLAALAGRPFPLR